MIKRAQILVRDCGRSSRSYFSSSVGQEFRQDYALIGIAEVDEDSYPEHIVRGFVARGTAGGITFHMTDFQRDLVGEGTACDIGDLVGHDIWPRPDPLMGLGGGGIVLRDCRMEAENGFKIMLLVGAASLPEGMVLHHHMYDATGFIGRWPEAYAHSGTSAGQIDLANSVDARIPMGESFSTLLKQPRWGWGPEKMGFTSTMDLPTIDLCSELEPLLVRDDLSDLEKARKEAILRTQAGSLFHCSSKDDMYQRFRRRIQEVRGPQRWDAVRTESEIEAMEEQASDIIRELMAEAA